MKAAVLQSNYIPWKGYFDIIHDVDLFVFYDDVQYTKRDWRNRNIILTANGPQYLSVPVSARRETLIYECKIADTKWQNKHYQALLTNYANAPYFRQYKDFLEYVYLETTWTHLYELNQFLIKKIARDFLGIKTAFSDSRQYHATGVKHERLLSIVRETGAASYLSGPAAKSYIDADDYMREGIELLWKDYSGYPEYPQRYESFNHQVSILDLLFNTGDDAPYYIWGWREK